MSLDGGTVDENLRGRATCRGQDAENVRPHALGRPADEPIVERLARAVDLGSIRPSATGLQNMDDPADHPPVIHPRYASGVRRQQRSQEGELCFIEPEIAVCHSDTPNM